MNRWVEKSLNHIESLRESIKIDLDAELAISSL